MNGYPIATQMVSTPGYGVAYHFERRPGLRGRRNTAKRSDAPHGNGRIRFETRRALRRGVAAGPSARGAN